MGRFAEAQAGAGASRLTAACRPDDHPALGFFAALPIAYLALVILFQVVKPLIVR